jgi:hypothetical protein
LKNKILTHTKDFCGTKKKEKKKGCVILQDFGGGEKTFAKFFYNGSYV